MGHDLGQWWLKKIILGLTLFFGVSLITFYLLVYYGHDISHTLGGLHETASDVEQIQQRLGTGLDFWERYFQFLIDTFSLNFGASQITHESILDMLLQAIPNTLLAIAPGMIVGHGIALMLAFLSAQFNKRAFDRVSTLCTSIIMSTSVLIITLMFQFIFCSPKGLNIFPVQGWRISSLEEVLLYAFVPNCIICFVVIGFNTRFYRSIFFETLQEEQILVAKAFGLSNWKIFSNYILLSSLIPISTRLIYALPFELIGGSLVIENFFNIPGMGSLTHEAMASNDMPVIRAVVTISSFGYVLIFFFIDFLYEWLDPRLTIRPTSSN